MPQELDPTVQHSRQVVIQAIVRDVTEAHSGDPLDVTRAALARGLDDAGFPPQPEKWITDTASEITEGRHVVVDRHLAESNGDAADQVPEEAGRTRGDRLHEAGHEGAHHLRDLFKGHRS